MKRGYAAGMTLPELLITLAVGAVLLSLAMPAYRTYVADSRITSATNLLVAHLNGARNKAITRGEPVSLCVSEDGASCSNTTTWESGWIVFTDSDGQLGCRFIIPIRRRFPGYLT